MQTFDSTNHPAFSDASYSGIRVAVFGASGFIGRWVARALSRQGADVVSVVRDASLARRISDVYDIRGEIVATDVTDTAAVLSTVDRLRPSITFNLVGYGVDPTERDDTLMQRINHELVDTLAGAISSLPRSDWRGQALVHAGSALEYGATQGELTETAPANPTTSYGITKLAGTRSIAEHARRSEIGAITARLFSVYGPGEHRGRLLPSLIDARRNDGSLQLTTGEQRRDFCYVGDVAEGLLRLGISNAPPGEIVNLATGRLTSVRSFAVAAARVLSIPSELLEFGATPTRGDEMFHGPVVVDRLRQLTGWLPATEINDGIRLTWELVNSQRNIMGGSNGGLCSNVTRSNECFDAA